MLDVCHLGTRENYPSRVVDEAEVVILLPKSLPSGQSNQVCDQNNAAKEQPFPASLKIMHESGERRSLDVIIFNAKLRGGALATWS